MPDTHKSSIKFHIESRKSTLNMIILHCIVDYYFSYTTLTHTHIYIDDDDDDDDDNDDDDNFNKK